MNYSNKSEHREFVRVEVELPVEYKFLGDESKFPDLNKPLQGKITSIGGGGLLLKGTLSDKTWIPRFVWQKIIVGVKFTLPGADGTIVALCRVAWIEDDDDGDTDSVRFGLMFREISNRDQDRVLDYVIHSYMN